MKIALLVPHGAPYSEERLVGVKRIVYYLTRELQKRNHSPTIIATSDSASQKHNFPIHKTIPSAKELNISVFDPRSFYYATVHSSKAAQIADNFDIIHSHMDYAFLPFNNLIKKPVVTTIHGTIFNTDEKNIFKYFYDSYHAVGISKKSIEIDSEFIKFNWQIYNGVDTDLFPFNEETTQQDMFLMGRINPDKGVKEAIHIAQELNKKLTVIGFKQIGKESYYDECVQLSKNDEYVDFKPQPSFDDTQNAHYYQHAKLFLFPVQYEETFASTILESMSCGTPVVAFARGSTPEQIIDGKTGFLVNPSDNDIRGNWTIKKPGIEGLKEAIEKIYSLSESEYKEMRQACREHILSNYSISKMVDNYENIYTSITKPHGTS